MSISIIFPIPFYLVSFNLLEFTIQEKETENLYSVKKFFNGIKPQRMFKRNIIYFSYLKNWIFLFIVNAFEIRLLIIRIDAERNRLSFL